jgi:hypothetical protein
MEEVNIYSSAPKREQHPQASGGACQETLGGLKKFGEKTTKKQ